MYEWRATLWLRLFVIQKYVYIKKKKKKKKKFQQARTGPAGQREIKLIRCCLQYDIKLMWRHQGDDSVGVAGICTATVDFSCIVVPDLLCS